MVSFRGTGSYVPSKPALNRALLEMQIERVGMIKKVVNRNVFDYELIVTLPEELERLKMALANKNEYKDSYAALIQLEIRLAPVLDFTAPYLEKYYSKKMVRAVCKPPVSALAFAEFSGFAKDHFTNQIFAFLLLDELAQASRVNHRLRTYALAVKIMTPYAYIKRHKVLIQLTHLKAPPLFGDVVANMHVCTKANKLSFWKTYNEKIEDVPLRLSNSEVARTVKLKG